MLQKKNSIRPAEPPLTAGVVCRFMYDFNCCGYEHEDGAHFKEGDVVTVFEVCEPNYEWTVIVSRVKSKSRKDRVPTALLTRQERKPVNPITSNYYHGRISRDESENRLHRLEKGTFLIRESSTNEISRYVISISLETEVRHYHLHFLAPGYTVTIDNDMFFQDLDTLISFYANYSNVGIATKLVKSLPPPEIKAMINGSFFVREGWFIPETEFAQESAKKTDEGMCKGNYRNKKVTIKSVSDPTARETLLHEASIMTHLDHPNILAFIGISENEIGSTYLITEDVSAESLLEYVRLCDRKVVDTNLLSKYAMDICDGMIYLSEQKFVYRNLALRNIVLTDTNLTAKISNFSFAVKASDRSWALYPSSNKWMAPESIKKRKFSHRSDVWSYGITLWELFSYGDEPYHAMAEDDILSYILKGNCLSQPTCCSAETFGVIRTCWRTSSKQRPTFRKLKEDLSNSLVTDIAQSERKPWVIEDGDEIVL